MCHNHPHYAWRSLTNHSANYTWFDGVDWHPFVVDTIGDTGAGVPMALNAADRPPMAYNEYDSGEMRFAYCTGLTWVKNSPDGEGYPGEQGISIAIDSDGYVHLLYCGWAGDTRELRHNTFNGMTWDIEVLAVDSTEIYDSCLAIDETDTLHVAFAPRGVDYALRYMSNDGTGWVLDPETIAGFSNYLDIAVRDGVPYIIYGTTLGSEFPPHMAYPLE